MQATLGHPWEERQGRKEAVIIPALQETVSVLLKVEKFH